MMIEKVCGARPRTCPWNVFKQPIVRETMALRSAIKARALPSKRSVPRRLLQALTFYEGAVRAARADKMERDRKRREDERNKNREP